MRKTILACVGVALVAGASTATAASLITSEDIKNGTIQSKDIENGTIKSKDVENGTIKSKDIERGTIKEDRLAADVRAKLNKPGVPGPKGDKGDTGPAGPKGDKGDPGITNLESDGPYPGATELIEGDNSTSFWTDDDTLQRSWVRCPGNKVALGGGFTLAADASLEDKIATQVTTSAPVQIEGGDPDTYSPIPGDVDGSFVPNGWLVEGVTESDNPALIVRPHVICATVR